MAFSTLKDVDGQTFEATYEMLCEIICQKAVCAQLLLHGDVLADVE